jgi:hypothetical protein
MERSVIPDSVHTPASSLRSGYPQAAQTPPERVNFRRHPQQKEHTHRFCTKRLGFAIAGQRALEQSAGNADVRCPER